MNVKAAGVNPVDTYIRSGNYAALPPLPYTPGRTRPASSNRSAPMCATSRPAIACISAAPSTAARPARMRRTRVCATSTRSITCRRTCTFAEGAGVGVPYVTAWRALFEKGRAVPARRC